MKAYTLLPLLLIAACAGEVDSESTDNARNPQLSEAEPVACETWGETQTCATEAGGSGQSECMYDPNRDYQLYFSACGDTTICSPGQTQSCGFDDGVFAGMTRGCTLQDGAWVWDDYGCNTPLVLSFDNGAVEFTKAEGAFDLVGAGLSVGHDWVSAKTPWVVLDRNGNGSIDDGTELFGSMTRLASGARAAHGFAALEELDQNGDGAVTREDPGFSRLTLWRDLDQDRRSTPEELEPLTEAGIERLSLRYARVPLCDATACEVERAGFVYFDTNGREKRGTIIDVHFQLY